VTKLEAVPDC